MSKIAFVFPGQGTQFIGMGQDIYDDSELKCIMDEVYEALPIDLKKAMFDGPAEILTDTQYTQPAIVLVSALLAQEMYKKIQPDFVAGHSVGEYSALSNNVLSLKETVLLSFYRGKFMSEVSKESKGSMAAILGLEADKIIDVLKNCKGVVEAVNFNEPKQTVISGDSEAVKHAEGALKEAGARRFVPLAVSGAFHSSLMKPAAEMLKEKIETLSFTDAKFSIISNTGVENIVAADAIKSELYTQVFGPVRWVETIEKLASEGVTTVYEIGPGKVLSGLIKKIDKSIEVINIQTLADIKAL